MGKYRGRRTAVWRRLSERPSAGRGKLSRGLVGKRVAGKNMAEPGGKA